MIVYENALAGGSGTSLKTNLSFFLRLLRLFAADHENQELIKSRKKAQKTQNTGKGNPAFAPFRASSFPSLNHSRTGICREARYFLTSPTVNSPK